MANGLGDYEAGAETPRPDADLLAAYVAGERTAFDDLVRRHQDRLWAVAVRTLNDREEAADALQDALLSAMRAAPAFRGDAAVTTWLHRIVVNSCVDRIRRRRARPTVPLPEPGPGELAEPGDSMADRETALIVREALDRLPVEQRSALVLVDLEGYPVSLAAEILGIAEGTVKSRCARGRARLAIMLGHLREPPLRKPPLREASADVAADGRNPAPVGSVGPGVRTTTEVGTIRKRGRRLDER